MVVASFAPHVRSKCRVPNVTSINHSVLNRPCSFEDGIRSKPFAQNGKLRAVFVDADVSSAHATLAVERRPTVQNTVVIDNYVTHPLCLVTSVEENVGGIRRTHCGSGL